MATEIFQQMWGTSRVSSWLKLPFQFQSPLVKGSGNTLTWSNSSELGHDWLIKVRLFKNISRLYDQEWQWDVFNYAMGTGWDRSPFSHYELTIHDHPITEQNGMKVGIYVSEAQLPWDLCLLKLTHRALLRSPTLVEVRATLLVLSKQGWNSTASISIWTKETNEKAWICVCQSMGHTGGKDG